MANDNDALHRSKTLFDYGMLREALRVAEGGLRRQPDDGRLWEIVGLISMRGGNSRQPAGPSKRPACSSPWVRGPSASWRKRICTWDKANSPV